MKRDIRWIPDGSNELVLKKDGKTALAMIKKIFNYPPYTYESSIYALSLGNDITNLTRLIYGRLMRDLKGQWPDVDVLEISYTDISPGEIGSLTNIHISVQTSHSPKQEMQRLAKAIGTIALLLNGYIDTCPTCGYEEAEQIHERDIEQKTLLVCEICSKLSDELLRGAVHDE